MVILFPQKKLLQSGVFRIVILALSSALGIFPALKDLLELIKLVPLAGREESLLAYALGATEVYFPITMRL